VSRKIPAREIITDLRGGMSKDQIKEKYRLSGDDVERIIDQIARERRARAEALAQDVRAGLSNEEILKKYQLSQGGLRSAFAALVDEGLMSLRELGSRNALETDSIVVNFRKNVRRKPIEKVTVCEPSHPERQYVLRDISPEGLSVFGMTAQVNQIVSLAILGDDDGDVMPFEFEAECRWAAPSFSGNPETAGFKIRNISEDNRGPLMALVQRYSRPSDGNGS
jgi:uncharacterized protein (DUF433 family)